MSQELVSPVTVSSPVPSSDVSSSVGVQTPSLGHGLGHSIRPESPESPESPKSPSLTAFSDDAIKGVFGQNFESLQASLPMLMKKKTVHKAPTLFSARLGTILDHRAVTVLEPPTGGGGASRSWAKVRATTPEGKVEGYVNTTDGVEDHPLSFQGGGEAIMAKQGPTPADVKQGMLGDCYLLSSLMSLAQRSPGFIKSGLFQTDPTEPADTYTVQFFKDAQGDGRGPFTPQRVQVQNTVLAPTATVRKSDGQTVAPGESIASHGDWAWPAIVEKAFFAWPGRNSIDTVNGGQDHRAAGMLTGEVHQHRGLQVNSDQLSRDGQAGVKRLAQEKEAVIDALNDGGSGSLTANTHSDAPDAWDKEPRAGKGGSGEKMVGGIAFGHVYSIVSANTTSITLRNPWGKYGRVNGKVRAEAAESVLSWEEFQFAFVDWTRAKA